MDVFYRSLLNVSFIGLFSTSLLKVSFQRPFYRTLLNVSLFRVFSNTTCFIRSLFTEFSTGCLFLREVPFKDHLRSISSSFLHLHHVFVLLGLVKDHLRSFFVFGPF